MALTFIVILLCDFIVLLFLTIFIFTFISLVSHLPSFLPPIYCHSSPLTFPFRPPIDVVQAFCSLFLDFFFLFGLLLCPEARSKMLLHNVDTCVSDCTNYIPCDSDLYTHCCENLKSQLPLLAYKNFFVTLCIPYILAQKITSSSIS